MHDLIADVHPLVAEAMSYVDHTDGELERLAEEQRLDVRRRAT
jgi:hypothetical protein